MKASSAIIDINMPGVDGLTVIGETRARGLNTAIPLVVITGQSDNATMLSAYDIGASAFIAKPIDWSQLLNVVFTDPQLATVGLLERNLKASKTKYLVASYPFDDHGKSILMEAKYGYVKVIAEPKRGRILGAEIVGKDAGELIHCFSGPLAMQATVFDLLRAPWYHPTLAEIITYPLEEIVEQLAR